MPKPIITHETRQYEPPKHAFDKHCDCNACQATLLWQRAYGTGYQARPTQRFWRGMRLAIPVCILTWAVLAAAGIWLVSSRAQAGHAPEPIKAPESLLRARQACPNDSTLVECRSALVRAYQSVEWQRHARWHAQASTSSDVVRDAITWASSQTGVPAWRLTAIGNCESHLFFLAHNGQYLGAWQLGLTHRSDPIFRVVPWMDPYAQAIHVARFIKAHGESQWQCSSSGGLRW